jgi:anti-sigma-K factor RskA
MIPLAENTTTPTTMPTTSPISIKLAANIDATSSAAKYARYVHQLLCSPLAATLLLALDKSTELQTIPGATPALI